MRKFHICTQWDMPAWASAALLVGVLALAGCERPPAPTADQRDAAESGPATEAPPVLDIDPSIYGRDNHNISQNQYRINPGFLNEGVIRLGDGIDMSEPGAPKRRAGLDPLDIAIPMKTAAVSDYKLDESFRYVEASSAREEADILSAYFQGSYKFVSAEAAYRRAVEERSSTHSIYAIVESIGQTADISERLKGKTLAWDPQVKPTFEGTEADPKEFRRQFLLDFGSHYVSAINYGYRVAIRGKITTTDSKVSQDITAAFKAAFITGSAEGGISSETKKTLSSSNLELTFVATSGGLYRDGEQRPGVLTRLEDIVTTLHDLRSGALKIHAAPLSATVRTYWNLLPTDFVLSRALLADQGTPPPPEGFYGVPAGTVIPWIPGEKAIFTDDNGKRHLVAPDGWALCDGTGGTPDLRNRFIRGTLELDKIGQAAGSATHTHTARSSKTEATYESHAGAFAKLKLAKQGHTHAITVDKAEVDPPHVKLAFLMKL